VLLRSRYLLAAALGLCAAAVTPAQEPGRLGLDRGLALPPAASANQLLADAVARTLRQGGQLRNYRIDLICAGGTVELTGLVANQAQREEALRLVQGVPGVERVLDHLTLADNEGIVRTGTSQGGNAEAGPTLPAPDTHVPEAAKPHAPTEPMPLAYGPPQGSVDLNPPKMPPYAWPTYAPYNNFARVGYPEAYPYNAWPFIGPIYPFPKVPLGWRSVKLEWQDGYWWFSKVATKYDWWRVRCW